MRVRCPPAGVPRQRGWSEDFQSGFNAPLNRGRGSQANDHA
ncbi:hypothetical protein ACFPM0_36645 [Pseudonocardia sulfidoxydans]